MSEIKDGGTAFPYTNCETHGISGGYGMTLRDYFAAQIWGVVSIDSESYLQAAQRAYEAADAMLAERDKP